MPNPNFLVNKAALINFRCYSVKNPEIDNLYGTIIINNLSTKNKKCLSKKGNTWYLKINTADKKVVKEITDPDLKLYINLSSELYWRELDKEKTWLIHKLLYKENFNLLIEMSPVINFKEIQPLVLDLKYNPKSDTKVIIDTID